MIPIGAALTATQGITSAAMVPASSGGLVSSLFGGLSGVSGFLSGLAGPAGLAANLLGGSGMFGGGMDSSSATSYSGTGTFITGSFGQDKTLLYIAVIAVIIWLIVRR